MPRPTGVKSNIWNGSPTSSWRTRATMMLGEVPTSVTMPPRSDANAIGMRKRDTETPLRRANWNATGIIIASAPMFLMKAENTATAVTRRIICARGERTCGEAKRIATSTAPERAMAALTRRALATMMTMSSLKPLNASFAGTMPARTAASSDSAATRS